MDQQELDDLRTLTEQARGLCIRQLLRANAAHRELEAVEFMQLVGRDDEILEELSIMTKATGRER